jgi:hypothetical protein
LLQRNVFRQRQRREKGTIGKTMGVMAGGPFGEKVADLSVVAGEDWKGVAKRVKVGPEVDSIADEISAQIRPALATR